MNKLIILIGLLYLFNNVANSVTYLEMTPYQEADCSGDVAGIGFRLVVGQCFAIDQTFYQLELSGDHANATLYQYSDSNCQHEVKYTDRSFEATYCYQAPSLVWNNWVEANNYVKVSVVVNPPYIPQFGHRQTTYAPGDKNCFGNPQFYWYATNNTKIYFDNQVAVFNCYHGQSIETICNPGCRDYNSMMSCSTFDGPTYGNIQESC